MAAWLLYTFFFLQILIPGTLFLLKHRRQKDIAELCVLYILFPLTVIIDVFKKKTNINSSSASETEDIPMWVGAGDLLVALFIGLTLGMVHGIVSFFFAYVFGSIIGIILLIGK